MTSIQSFDDIVAKLKMEPHPEGGFYRETYRSTDDAVFASRGKRSSCTSIYFLMPCDQMSKFHRLSSDEIWHFHQGDCMTVVMINSRGEIVKKVTGPVGDGEAMPQIIIPKNTWFGAIHEGPRRYGYTLVGCTVSPGFEFADFELGSRNQLLQTFSHASSETRDWIITLTTSES